MCRAGFEKDPDRLAEVVAHPQMSKMPTINQTRFHGEAMTIMTPTIAMEIGKLEREINKHRRMKVNDINKTLEERGNRYGDFSGHAAITYSLKNIMRKTEQWQHCPDIIKETLDMVAHKIGRILNGDPLYGDNWHDIIGYVKLVEDRLKDYEWQVIDPFSGVKSIVRKTKDAERPIRVLATVEKGEMLSAEKLDKILFDSIRRPTNLEAETNQRRFTIFDTVKKKCAEDKINVGMGVLGKSEGMNTDHPMHGKYGVEGRLFKEEAETIPRTPGVNPFRIATLENTLGVVAELLRQADPGNVVVRSIVVQLIDDVLGVQTKAVEPERDAGQAVS